MEVRDRGASLELRQVEQGPLENCAERIGLRTNAGTIQCRVHDAPSGDTAALWVFGAGGGLGGPAGGVYTRLARELVNEGITSLELDYRRPGDLVRCVADVLLGVSYLGARGRGRVVLVGHSFGGAVVITAGADTPQVIAVAALSSQSYGTERANQLSPRPLLVAHGTADEVLPDTCSRDIYRRAKEPKRLILYPGCRHGLDQCREDLDRDLLGWVREVAGVRE